ncbi:MAG: putative molecular chaperone distantly related to HSP70-fold metalloprotease [Pseudomonadota bacterium]
MSYCIGLMSGTSLDGVDGALLAFDENTPGGMRVVASCGQELPRQLRAALYDLNQPGTNELHRAALATHELVQVYAQVSLQLVHQAGIPKSQIAAIGAHGQTVRHQPPSPYLKHPPYTLQLNNPALLAELTGIPVVADFRTADVAAGGQGAPLVPAFHHAVFGKTGASVAVVNIGGIANVSALCASGKVFGFDTGPGNALMDSWCQQHTGQTYDANGSWAAQGSSSAGLLNRMLAEPYFAQPGIKSTGRDLFHTAWLMRMLDQQGAPIRPQDVQATLLELTAISIANGIEQAFVGETAAQTVLLCGGGAKNGALVLALQNALQGKHVTPTSELGWPVDLVEAAAFAWLTHQHLVGLPGNLPAVTGAHRPKVLGGYYPA